MKRRLLLHVFFVSFANYLSNGLYMVRGLLLAHLLGPAVFGVWTAMRMVQTLGFLAPIGTRQGMVQLAPLAEGAGEHERAARLTQTASSVALFSAVPFATLVALGGLASQQPLEWLAFALVLLLGQLFDFYHGLARARQRFALASTGQIVIAVVTTALGITAAWRFGLMGFIAALGAANAATLILFRRAGLAYAPPIFDRAAARELFVAGFPMMLSGGLFTLLWNVDKLLLWVARGSEALGIYAVQASFSMIALLAPAALGTVLHPHLMRRLGEAREPATVRPYLVRGGELLATWSAPIAGLGCVALHLPIRWWLSQYTPAIEPGRVLMVASYFSMIASVPIVVVIALNGQRLLCCIRLVAILVAAVGGLIGLRQGFLGLALGMSAALMLDSLWTHLEALRRAEIRDRAAWQLTVLVLAPFVLLLGSLWLGWRLLPDIAATWQADLLLTGARASIVVLPCAAWAAWRSHQLKLLS